MKSSTIKILLAIFAILLVVAMYPYIAPKIPGLKNMEKSEYEQFFSKFNKDQIKSLSFVKQAGEEIKLTRDEEGWKANSYIADSTQVDKFIDSLTSTNIEQLASKNPDNHSSFNLDEDTATIMTIITDSQESKFLIGKQGSGSDTFYVKKEGADRAYLADGKIRTQVTQSIDKWRDKKIITLSQDSIKEINFSSADLNYTLTRDNEGKWQAKQDGQEQALDETKTNAITANLNPLEGTGFLTDEEKQEYESASKANLNVVDKDGNTYKLNMVNKDTEWWVNLEGQETHYKISNSKINSLTSAVLTEEAEEPDNYIE